MTVSRNTEFCEIRNLFVKISKIGSPLFCRIFVDRNYTGNPSVLFFSLYLSIYVSFHLPFLSLILWRVIARIETLIMAQLAGGGGVEEE
jgi:hypothetical protein